jgi:CBS domain containing-hemolysin-like protein
LIEKVVLGSIVSLLGARVQEISDLPAMTWTEVLSRLLSVLLLIAINAFFVAAEFSMVTVRRSRINQLVDGGDVAAQTVQSLQQSIQRLLSTMQLGITLSSLALGWIGEDTIAVLVRICDRLFAAANLHQVWDRPFF